MWVYFLFLAIMETLHVVGCLCLKLWWFFLLVSAVTSCPVWLFCRWRNSFLFGLVFVIPVMIIMISFMLTMPKNAECLPLNESYHLNDSSNQTIVSSCSSHMVMVVPGLSLLNLLLFLLCTPCQVSAMYICARWLMCWAVNWESGVQIPSRVEI